MPTVADYIVCQLKRHNVEALFGVPAFYCSAIFEAAESAADFRTVVTSSDLEAGYAADGYARVRGLAAVSVAYGVGTLSLVNAVAGAYAERSPVLVINGGPTRANVSLQESERILFSHSTGHSRTDLDMLRPFTGFCERVETIETVPPMVNQAIAAAMRLKRPAYIEIPRDLLTMACPPQAGFADLAIAPGDAEACAEAAVTAIRSARSPLLIVGVEIQRYRLSAPLASLICKLNLRWATTLLGRSSLPEETPGFLGVFNGKRAPACLRAVFAESDFILSIGAMFGAQHASQVASKLDVLTRVWDGSLIRQGLPDISVSTSHFVAALEGCAQGSDPIQSRRMAELGDCSDGRSEDKLKTASSIGAQSDLGYSRSALATERPVPPPPKLHDASNSSAKTIEYAIDSRAGINGRGLDQAPKLTSLPPETGKQSTGAPMSGDLTYDSVFATIQEAIFLDRSMRLIVDTCLGIYPAARMRIPGQDSFLSSGLWASIGHSLGAAVGAAIPGEKRPVVICGDGGLQMLPQALSTMARYAQNTIVIVVDNGIYGYNQWLLEPSYYDQFGVSPKDHTLLHMWDCLKVAEGMGVASRHFSDTVSSLRNALAIAKMTANGPSIIRALIPANSLPQCLKSA